MKKQLIFIAILAIPLAGQAQLGGLIRKVKQKAETVVDKATDKILEGSAGDPGANETVEKEQTAQLSQTKQADPLTAYSRFDFLPGEKLIYAEDFADAAIGEFPLQWTTKGRGEIMTLEGKPGKWLRGYKGSTLTAVNKNELGDNYTIEFDLVYYFGAQQQIYVMPDLIVRLMNNFTVDYTNRSGMVSAREGEQSFQFQIHPKEEASLAWVDTYGNKSPFTSDKTSVSEFSSWYNQPVHYAIQVQKSRVRVWLNEKKVFDLPQALSMDKKPARIAFSLGDTSFDETQVGYYVSNIRMATGLPDTRHKLLENGSFSTTGILFEANTDRIKPESFGVLNQIIKVLSENPGIRIKITGHTSADGNTASNQELSVKRAAAVKEQFIKSGIQGSRLETAGYGDSKPVAANSTQAGRAANRRVEFTKL